MGLMALIELGDLRGFTGNPQNADALKLGRHAPNSEPSMQHYPAPYLAVPQLKLTRLTPATGNQMGERSRKTAARAMKEIGLSKS